MTEKPGYRVGPFTLYPNKLDAMHDGQWLGLRPAEYKILLALADAAEQNPGCPVTTEELKAKLETQAMSNVISVHVKGLRIKLFVKGRPLQKGQSHESYARAARKTGTYDENEFIKNTTGGYILTIRDVQKVEPGGAERSLGATIVPDQAARGLESSNPPYIGSRSFQPEDAGIFFGRTQARQDLIAALTKDRVVLLYSPSGAGKTSLLNVALRSGQVANDFQVLYVPRVALPSDFEQVPAPQNPFTFSAVAALGYNKEVLPCTWTEYLNQYYVSTTANDVRVLLIIDQLEEIIISAPSSGYEKAQRDFFLELSNALWDDKSLRLVLSFREEFYVQVLRLANIITDQRRYPEWNTAPFPLGKLTPDEAKEAIIGPALSSQGVEFRPHVLDALVYELAPDQYEDVFGQKHGEVEPLQLQLVCRALWGCLSERSKIIDWEDVESALGTVTKGKLKQVHRRDAIAAFVNSVLQNFCGYAVEKVASETKFPADLIDLGCQQFVSKSGYRRFVHQDREYTGQLPNNVVTALERQQLLHSEQRGLERLYGLAHDKLIEPIRERAAPALRRRGQSAFPKIVSSILLCVSGAGAAALGTMIIRGFFAIPGLTLTQAPDVSWAAGWFHGVIGALVWGVFIAGGLSCSWFFLSRRGKAHGAARAVIFGAAAGLIGGAFITVALLWAQRLDSLWAALWISTRDSRITAFTVTGVGYSMLVLGTGVGLGTSLAVTRILQASKWEMLVEQTPKRMTGPETLRVLIAICRFVLRSGTLSILSSMAITALMAGLIVHSFRSHFVQPQLSDTVSLGLISAPLWARLLGECLSITGGGLTLAIGLLFGIYVLRKGIDLPDEEIFSVFSADGED